MTIYTFISTALPTRPTTPTWLTIKKGSGNQTITLIKCRLVSYIYFFYVLFLYFWKIRGYMKKSFRNTKKQQQLRVPGYVCTALGRLNCADKHKCKAGLNIMDFRLPAQGQVVLKIYLPNISFYLPDI